jgi:hypothetical protein
MKQSELNEVADAIRCFASAITPAGTEGVNDAAGGFCKSLTEAVMGITAAGMAIAASIDNLALSVDSSIDNLSNSIDYINTTDVADAGFSNPTKRG